LIEQQAKELRRLQDEFEGLSVCQSTGGPNAFAEWLVQSQGPGGSFWNTARLLYEGAFGQRSAVKVRLYADFCSSNMIGG